LFHTSTKTRFSPWTTTTPAVKLSDEGSETNFFVWGKKHHLNFPHLHRGKMCYGQEQVKIFWYVAYDMGKARKIQH
jgi:hypothetical protein